MDGVLVPTEEKSQIQTMLIRRGHVKKQLGKLKSRWSDNTKMNIGILGRCRDLVTSVFYFT
jgi:hypothetical protein